MAGISRASSSVRFSEVVIPEPWAKECCLAIHKILAFPRTRQALAQIFDGIQTIYSATDTGDDESMDKLTLTTKVSEEAEEKTRDWFMSVEKIVNDTMIDAPPARAALEILRSEAANPHKIGALVHGFIRPVIRNLLREYLRHCESVGHLYEGSFWQIHYPEISTAESVWRWAEEYIFGGELGPSQDETKVCSHLCETW
jgi:hypothetical protein